MASKEGDPGYHGWSTCMFRMEQLVYTICFILNLVFLFVINLAFENRIFISWDWYAPKYNETIHKQMYMHTEVSGSVVEANTFGWFTIFVFTWLSVVFAGVLLVSPSRLYVDVSKITAPNIRAKQQPAVLSQPPTPTGFFRTKYPKLVTYITTHYTDDNYGFVYLYLARTISRPLTGVFVLYLLGQQSGAVLWSGAGVFLFLDIIFFAGDFALDSLRSMIEAAEHAADHPTAQNKFMWLSFPLQSSVPVLIFTFWIFLITILSKIFYSVFSPSIMPVPLSAVVWAFIVNLIAASLSFLVTMVTLLMYAAYPEQEIIDSSYVRWKIHGSNILLLLSDTAVVIAVFMVVQQYTLSVTTGSTIL